MSMLETLFSKVYKPGWKPVATKTFTDDDIFSMRRVKVVQGNYGLSLRIDMNDGSIGFIPLSNDSTAPVGFAPTEEELKKIKVVQLHKDGELDIYRAVIQC